MYTGNCIHIVVHCEICFRYVFSIWWIIIYATIYAECNLKECNFYIWPMRNEFLINWLTKYSNINWNHIIIEISLAWILFHSKSLNHWHPNNSWAWLHVLVMSRTHFRVNLHSIFAWMSRNSLRETSAISGV